MYYHQNTDNIDACIALLLSKKNSLTLIIVQQKRLLQRFYESFIKGIK